MYNYVGSWKISGYPEPEFEPKISGYRGFFGSGYPEPPTLFMYLKIFLRVCFILRIGKMKSE